ncbi:MAG: hypothetical protein JRF56_05640 [Deltaproteobacteria bacterium]|jgi:hypothetical protein|nr:hypothetical protein [Deltaproteobacteria bacterium]
MNIRALTIGVLITALIANSQAFAAQFLFTPRAFVNETYTDNLFLTQDDTEDDFITTVSAGFAMQLLGRTSGLDFSFDPNYQFYQDFSEFDEWGLLSDLRVWLRPSKASNLELRNNFIRTTDPVPREDQVVVEGGRVGEEGDTTIRRDREPYYRNTGRLNYSYQFGREDQVYAGFRYGLLRNDSNFVEDNDFYRLNGGLDYWFSRQFGGQFFGEYTRGEFTQQSGFVGEGSSDFDNWLGSLRFLGRLSRHFSLFVQYNQVYRDFTSGDANNYLVYAPSAGFVYDISEDTFLRLGLGYFYQDIDNEKNQENPFLNGEISKTWNYQRGLINLAGLAGLTQNDFGAQNLGFQQFATIRSSARYDFTRRIVGDTSAWFRYSFTPGETEDIGDEEDRRDGRAQFNAGIGFLATHWMNIRLGYTFNYFNSNADEDYFENRAMLTITLQPDRPWRF